MELIGLHAHHKSPVPMNVQDISDMDNDKNCDLLNNRQLLNQIKKENTEINSRGPDLKVVVSNLNYRTTWKSLKDHMKAAGDVVTVHVLFMNGRPSGRGIVVYRNMEDAVRAVATLDRTMLESRCIVVRASRSANTSDAIPSNGIGTSHVTLTMGPLGSRPSPVDSISIIDPDKQSNEETHSSSSYHGAQRVAIADLVNEASRSAADDHETSSGGMEHVAPRCGATSTTVTQRSNTTSSSNETVKSTRADGTQTKQPDRLRSVFVGNIAYTTTWQSLKDHMRQAGVVSFADIFLDRRTLQPSGSGIVRYISSKACKKAIRTLTGTILNGRQIYVRADRAGHCGKHGSFVTSFLQKLITQANSTNLTVKPDNRKKS